MQFVHFAETDSARIPLPRTRIQMATSTNASDYTSIIARVMSIENTTLGGPQHTFRFRARGTLSRESEEAFEEIAVAVRGDGLIPILREEDGKHIFYLVPKPKGTESTGSRWNLILFLLTIASVVFVGAINALPAESLPLEVPENGVDLPFIMKYLMAMLLEGVKNLPAGLPFAISLLGVLGSHELGHYLAGRRNGTPVSLPFFIPLPIPGSFGTMGAVIAMREPPRNRNRLTEIAIAGPLTGFLIAIPILLYGLSLSKVEPLPTSFEPGYGLSLEGNSIAYLAAKFAVFGKLLPAPAVFDVSPVLFYLRAFFTGFPLPMAGEDVMIHPIAFGAWVGLMITGLNLIPAGQLDGGHMLYAILGDRAAKVLPFIIAVLVILGFFWPGWFLWAALIFLFGRGRAEPLDTVSPLDARHRALALLGLALFLLLFTPIPIQTYGV